MSASWVRCCNPHPKRVPISKRGLWLRIAMERETRKTGRGRLGRKPRGRGGPELDGFVLVDKPKGITSFDVIRRLRRILGFSKMGHMGTLDPNATGLLPICLGKATRLSRFLLRSHKSYLATIRLGRATNTYDTDGETVGESKEPPRITAEELDELLGGFRGTFMQRPPIFSAKKVGGKRLYEYAREGEAFEPEPCEVTIHQLDLLKLDSGRIELRITGSSGMYVRSLAHDIGEKLECGAYLEDLVRLSVGGLSLEDAHTLERIEELERGSDRSFLKPMLELLHELPVVKANPTQVNRIRNGTPIVITSPSLGDGQRVRVVDDGGELVAVGDVKKPLGSLQLQVFPKVVLH